jgi:hypothetical protein
MFAALPDAAYNARAATSVGAPEAAGSPQPAATAIDIAARAAAVKHELSLKRAGSEAWQDVR